MTDSEYICTPEELVKFNAAKNAEKRTALRWDEYNRLEMEKIDADRLKIMKNQDMHKRKEEAEAKLIQMERTIRKEREEAEAAETRDKIQQAVNLQAELDRYEARQRNLSNPDWGAFT